MSTMRVTMTRTTMGESGSLLTAGSTYTVSTAFGAYLVGQAKAATDPDGALSPLGSEPLRLATNPVTGAASAVDGAGNSYPLARGVPILAGASAGADSGWLPINAAPERFAYQLDSGSTTTTFSIDISADGATSLGQAFTGTWASSSSAEITPQIMFSNPLAKFFRWNVVSGGPLSVNRGM